MNYLAVQIKGPQPKPTIESFETIEAVREFLVVAKELRPEEEWTIIDSEGKTVE